eukprot:TRINITY_DN253_c14_g1_i1.p1 TRINITY_DN253_c14_g1~~TRINITY_DN253_c14_g1_i1.p1  ORF type:complete len:332 (+),score=76.58 TRINITY_DN253_c14_g1_i1:118-1113(+)
MPPLCVESPTPLAECGGPQAGVMKKKKIIVVKRKKKKTVSSPSGSQTSSCTTGSPQSSMGNMLVGYEGSPDFGVHDVQTSPVAMPIPLSPTPSSQLSTSFRRRKIGGVKRNSVTLSEPSPVAHLPVAEGSPPPVMGMVERTGSSSSSCLFDGMSFGNQPSASTSPQLPRSATGIPLGSKSPSVGSPASPALTPAEKKKRVARRRSCPEVRKSQSQSPKHDPTVDMRELGCLSSTSPLFKEKLSQKGHLQGTWKSKGGSKIVILGNDVTFCRSGKKAKLIENSDGSVQLGGIALDKAAKDGSEIVWKDKDVWTRVDTSNTFEPVSLDMIMNG